MFALNYSIFFCFELISIIGSLRAMTLFILYIYTYGKNKYYFHFRTALRLSVFNDIYFVEKKTENIGFALKENSANSTHSLLATDTAQCS